MIFLNFRNNNNIIVIQKIVKRPSYKVLEKEIMKIMSL